MAAARLSTPMMGVNCSLISPATTAKSSLRMTTQPLLERGVRVSMDGRGRALDNIFVERLWRTVKYEYVYLQEIQTVQDARSGLREFFDFYNHERFHQSLDYRTPAQVYLGRQHASKTEEDFYQPASILIR